MPAKDSAKQIPNETKQGRKLSFVTECAQILADFTETRKKTRLGHGEGLKMTVHKTLKKKNVICFLFIISFFQAVS